MDRVCSKCRQSKPASEFGSTGGGRLRSSCRPCERRRDKGRRIKDPKRSVASYQKWRAANPDKAKASYERWKRENPERRKEHSNRYRAANLQKARSAVRRWAENNPGRAAELEAARRASELRATPPWADKKAIRAIYAEAARLTRETGVQHHVDHIVPLRGKNVCGLHVHWNLRAIPKAENISKGAKLLPVDGFDYF